MIRLVHYGKEFGPVAGAHDSDCSRVGMEGRILGNRVSIPYMSLGDAIQSLEVQGYTLEDVRVHGCVSKKL